MRFVCSVSSPNELDDQLIQNSPGRLQKTGVFCCAFRCVTILSTDSKVSHTGHQIGRVPFAAAPRAAGAVKILYSIICN